MNRLVVTGATVFDGRRLLPGPLDVAVEADRIVEIGPHLAGPDRIDVTGMTLLPGLIDTHVHTVLSGVDRLRMLDEPFSYQFYAAERNMQALLEAGITTVRDAGGADLGMKVAVAEGLVVGPELVIAVTLLGQTGGHTDGWAASGLCAPLLAAHPGRPAMVVDGVDEMRQRVREIVRAGADVIKICTSGGVLSTRSDPQHPHFTPAEIEAAVDEAERAGIGVMAHAIGTQGIKNAIRAGVRSIEHAIFLDDEAIELAVHHGTWIVPTLLAPVLLIEAIDRGASVGPTIEAKARSVATAHAASISRAVQAGVKIAFGTDSGVFGHGPNLREMELLTAVGMAPAQVLQAATAGAAELLGRDDIGVIEPGAHADLVLVRGGIDSLAGIADRVDVVVSRGRVVKGALAAR